VWEQPHLLHSRIFQITTKDRTGLVVRELMRGPLMIVVAAGQGLATALLSDLARLAKKNFVGCSWEKRA